jgi:hypothetical protein
MAGLIVSFHTKGQRSGVLKANTIAFRSCAFQFKFENAKYKTRVFSYTEKVEGKYIYVLRTIFVGALVCVRVCLFVRALVCEWVCEYVSG